MDMANNREKAAQIGLAARNSFEKKFTEQVMKDMSWKVYKQLLIAKGLL